ncbi:hypothetical protein ACFFV7_09645 [Nonomuraea spiralis]|uniref:Uncharacterized protein n=1 Tax=Nonomuraea spiralis TaxID=46182 RepID=A0ABV5IBG1_9ACTN|nr:hypothetical protein [Nonomuraea spiralis]
MNTRGMWLAIIVVAGVVVAVVAGGLAWIGGVQTALAILTGGAAFSGFTLLALTVATFLTRTPS